MEPAKLFISHASEDKEDFVEPLAHALSDAGFEVWYDKFVLTIGDSLLRKISEGLSQCDFGVVVLSNHFFHKEWPQAELDGLFELQTAQRKVILPVWKDVTKADVLRFSPMLAGRLGAMASHGVAAVVDEIKRAVETTRTVEKFSTVENALSRFRSLDQRVSGSRRAQQLGFSEEGVKIVREAAESAIAALKKQLEDLGKSSENMKFNLDPKRDTNSIAAGCPYRVTLLMSYRNSCVNSLSETELYFILAHNDGGFVDDSSDRDVVRQHTWKPEFDPTGKLVWKNDDDQKSLTTEQLVPFVLNELLEEIQERHAEAEAKKQL